ncbi:MAG: acetylglutamate kinase [Xanthomonadales bacterium]|nr:acetylglutamate kinase [Xanthomonadales bacterium]
MNEHARQDLRTVVSQVLSQLGTSREAQYYLKRFSQSDTLQFAVIKVGGAVLERELEPLAAALALLRNLGLMPIILHGAGPQLDQALAEAGIATHKRDGLRVTTPEVMEVVRPVIYRANRRLVQALQDQGVVAQGIQHGVFECEYLDQEQLGLVGKVLRVDLEAIRDVVRAGALPVVACLGESAIGQVMNINADIAARELIWAVRPHKIIFLTDTGGLLDESGRVISAINLRSDFEYLSQQDWVHSGMLLKLEQIRQLLAKLPDSASVSITAVANLATELFTHRGAGTLIRNGEAVIESDRIDEAELAALRALLEQSFNRTLADGYFEDLPLECVMRSESNGAVAIVLRGVDGIPYLDKFAVTPEAQGAGLGAAVWTALAARCPRLYWRSRADNPLTRWYFERSDATFSSDRWVAFSRGIDDFAQLSRCRDDCFSRAESWLPAAPGDAPGGRDA